MLRRTAAAANARIWAARGSPFTHDYYHKHHHQQQQQRRRRQQHISRAALRSLREASSFTQAESESTDVTTEGRKRPRNRRELPKALKITPAAEKFLGMLQTSRSNDERKGFVLSIKQAPNNLQMVFAFDFVSSEDDTNKGFADKVPFAEDDSLALYIDSSALMKVLGTTVDYDNFRSSLVVLNPEGEEVSPDT